MMTVFRDRQVRLAMLLLYGLAALCLLLAHTERVFAEPPVDRLVFCLSDAESNQDAGLPDCGLCSLDQSGASALPAYVSGAFQATDVADIGSFPENQPYGAVFSPPVGSRAPPVLS